MNEPLDPWWMSDLRGHPLAVAHGLDSDDRWAPTPAPALRVESNERSVSVHWQLDDLEASHVDVEVVGDLLVLRAMSNGQTLSRALPLPKDVDLGRRRDHWRKDRLEVVVPRIRPTALGRVRLWAARILRQLAELVAPKD